MSIAERTAHNIREEMTRQHLTQADLAEVIDVSQPGISERLRGRRRFQLHEVAMIAAFLDVPLSELVPAEDVTA